MNLCKDCKHFTVAEEIVGKAGCSGRVDPVNGEPTGIVPAYAERGSQGLCGPLGALYEAIPTVTVEAAPEAAPAKATRQPRKAKEKPVEKPEEAKDGEQSSPE